MEKGEIIVRVEGEPKNKNTALVALLKDEGTDFRSAIGFLSNMRLKRLAQHIHGEIYNRLP